MGNNWVEVWIYTLSEARKAFVLRKSNILNFSDEGIEDEWDIALQELGTKYSLQEENVLVSSILKMIKKM